MGYMIAGITFRVISEGLNLRLRMDGRGMTTTSALNVLDLKPMSHPGSSIAGHIETTKREQRWGG